MAEPCPHDISLCHRGYCKREQKCAVREQSRPAERIAETKDELPVTAYMHFTKDGNIRAWSSNISDQTLAAVTEAIGRDPVRVCDHAAAQSRINALLEEVEVLRAWKKRVIDAAEHAHGPDAMRFKLSLYANSRARNQFPGFLDGRWVSFVFAEDDAHIGYIAKALDASLSAGRSGSGEASNG